jgi:NAD(P) transhydrogenase
MSGHYDLIVIGSGPAGQKGAINAAKNGKRVALIEQRNFLGGVCINTGTIPSKSLREAVLHLTGLRQRTFYGTSYSVKQNITMRDLMLRCSQIIRTEIDVLRGQMERNGIEMFTGTASFLDPHTVRIYHFGQNTDITGDCILVAVGTTPARPDFVPFMPGRVLDSDGLLKLDELPKSLIVVGGGVIGVEYACMMQTVGVKTTLIERRPRILEFLDDELAEALQYHMRSSGLRFKLGESVAEIKVEGESVTALLGSGKRLTTECLLYVIGRQGATDKLQLENAGLTADDRGRLTVNENYQTQVPHIYAAGDVIGFPSLASTSMEQGRLAICHAFGLDCVSHPQFFPYGIYAIPELSMVGKSERELTKDNVPYEVGIGYYNEIARGQIIGDHSGMLKVLFHQETHQLLGVHIIGEGATELIHIGQAVLSLGGTVNYFVETVFNYPTLAEAYKVAAMDGLNRLSPAARACMRERAPAPHDADLILA